MFLVIYNDGNCKLYHSVPKFINDTFSPESQEDIYCTINFSLGKCLSVKQYKNEYERKKARLEDIAVEWSLERDAVNLSWSEYSAICNWFYVNGKRFGLLKEFQENAIC